MKTFVSRQKSTMCILLCLSIAASISAQDILSYRGDSVPQNIENMYTKGLNYLVKTQTANGAWQGNRGAEPGVVGVAVLAMLAHGEDPNFGPYSESIGKGLEYILESANDSNGYIGTTMYNHGFATLALAEAYGSVKDPRLGPALEKAVKLILSSQAENPFGGWRYSPTSSDADTTVSGAQMVALFAARNAGIAIPDKAIKRGLDFFRSVQGGDGGFGYASVGATSAPRSAVGTLVLALADKKGTTEFKAAFRNLQQINLQSPNYMHYYLYYASQAFFHADMEAWRKWNSKQTKQLSETQLADGSWSGQQGPAFSTAASLLCLAVNYRFLPIYER